MLRKERGFIAMRKLRSDAKPIDLNVAKNLYAWGLSLHTVAKIMGIHHTNLMMRFRRFGIPTRPQKEEARKIMAAMAKSNSEPKNYGWKGGHTKTQRGYIVHNAEKKYLHRLIAEKVLGRPLRTNEVVHHIDGNRANNSNDNLLICSHSYHACLHAKMAEGKIGINYRR